MDWRDSRLGRLLFYVLAAIVLVPKPLTPWQNVTLDAILIPVGTWMVWPVFRRVTTPKE